MSLSQRTFTKEFKEAAVRRLELGSHAAPLWQVSDKPTNRQSELCWVNTPLPEIYRRLLVGRAVINSYRGAHWKEGQFPNVPTADAIPVGQRRLANQPYYESANFANLKARLVRRSRRGPWHRLRRTCLVRREQAR